MPYCAAKFALTGFSRGLRAELGRYGILVTTVCPGLMRTGSAVRGQFKGRHREQQTWFTVTGSLPGPSISAGRAARQIVEACRAGQARLIISMPAKLAAMAEALAPGAVSAGFGAIDRMLPRPGGIGAEWAEGLDSKSRLSPSVLTALTARAAERNLELPAGRRWEYV
jgi:NAD(P)-dependent dehydrogenase (short-subunit alcohol dehydrogenase family)